MPVSDWTTGTSCQCQTGLQGHRASVSKDYRDIVPVSDRTAKCLYIFMYLFCHNCSFTGILQYISFVWSHIAHLPLPDGSVDVDGCVHLRGVQQGQGPAHPPSGSKRDNKNQEVIRMLTKRIRLKQVHICTIQHFSPIA